jgi:hypothetical protein
MCKLRLFVLKVVGLTRDVAESYVLMNITAIRRIRS